MQVQCCIAGGGPAGMMLGYLLARAGVEVVVLEKHADFLRDFRGDTIHPSTLDILYELGLLDDFLKLPHQEVRQLRGWVGDFEVDVADFSHLPTHCQFLALMPQWDFLNFLVEKAKPYPSFHLILEANVVNLIEESGRVAGVRVVTPQGPLEVRSDLLVGADGRHSIVREKAGLVVESLGAPIDVLWMRLTRHADDPLDTFGRVDNGRILAMLNRETYWQIAYVIPKGANEQIRAQGLPAFRASVAQALPFLKDRVDELHSWDDIKLLTVLVDRLRDWYKPGLLCIGDAAHAMSPIGGVGINLAIQDAVAAGNLLAESLRKRTTTLADLKAVQKRRWLPVRLIQWGQVFIQNHVIGAVLQGPKITRLPWLLRLANRWPVLQRIPARIVGVGFRPEHVKTPR